MKLKHCGIYHRLLAVTLLSVQVAILSSVATAQSDEVEPSPRLKYLKDIQDPMENQKPQAETSQGMVIDVPYSKVFKDTDGVDLFRTTHIDPYEPRFGEGGGVKVDAGILNHTFGLPLTGRPRFKIDQAELKLSNFYIDIRSLSASFLYSDNVNHSEFRRDDGTLVGLRLDLALFAPITERLRISATAAFIYLPLQNRAGFALYDSLKQFEYNPFFRTQFAYDFTVANWEVELTDDFTIQQVPFDFQISYSYFDGAFKNPEREGRYSYGGGASGVKVFEDTTPYGSFDPGLVRARNTVGGKASRLLPTETRFEVGGYHSDESYLSGDASFLGLPHSREWAYASLRSERENLRFKPFAIYRTTHYDYYQNWEHEVRGGIEGPITRNISLYASAGEQWLNLGTSKEVWHVALRHQIGPYTSHSFEYSRDTTQPDVDLRDRWTYRVSQVIGNGFTVDAYASWATFEDLDGTGTSSDDLRTGVRFIYLPSVKTSFMVAGTYTSSDYARANGYDPQIWHGVARVTHKFTPTFEAQVQYDYTDRNSKARGDSYYENFTSLSLIKYF